MQSPAFFQNIFKFCVFFLSFSNILPFSNIFLSLFFFPLSWKIACMPLLSKIGPQNQAMLLVRTFLIHNSRTKIFPDKQFCQNAGQEIYIKKHFQRNSIVKISEKFKNSNLTSLSCHEQVCLIKLCFKRYFSHHPNDERSISWNVASLNILIHDAINLSHYDKPSQIACMVMTMRVTCMQTALHVHKTLCTLLIPLYWFLNLSHPLF